MANNLTAGNPEYRSRRMQVNLRTDLLALQTANFEERSSLTKWDVVNRPMISSWSVRDYIKWQDTTTQDRTITNEKLEINQTKEITSYIDDVDKIQSNYSLVNTIVDDDTYQMQNEIDGRYLREVKHARLSCDDWDLWWIPWTWIALSLSNVIKTFAKAKAIMKTWKVETNRIWNCFITPDVASVLEQKLADSWFKMADKTLKAWYKGDFLWLRFFESNNVAHLTELTYTGNISTNDTFTVAGVVFIFKTTPSNPWEVDLWATSDDSMTNLMNAVNWWWVAWTDYIAVSQSDRDSLNSNWVELVLDTTWSVLKVYTSWKVAVSESMSNTISSFTFAMCELARQGATDVVIQKDPWYLKREPSNKIWSNYITRDLYWIKTFSEWSKRMLALKILS